MKQKAEKTLEYYLKLPYTVELRETPGAGWFARVVELPGCMSQGDTAEDAIAMLREAKELWLEVALEDGKPIPEPRGADGYSGKFVLRLPPWLHRSVAEDAERDGVSLNQYVSLALARAVGRPMDPPAGSIASTVELPVWPGLDRATRAALARAGLTQNADELDERLFGEWLSRYLREVERALAEGDRKAALETLDFLLVVLRPGAGGNLVLQSIVQMLALLRQSVETASGAYRGMAEEAVLRN